MPNEVVQLAYESGRSAVQQQDTTLGNLRNRATALLASSAVGTSIATAVGVLNVDRTKGIVFPHWAAWTTLGLVFIVGSSTMAVLWPAAGWNYGLAPNSLIELSTRDPDSVRDLAAKALARAVERNSVIVDRKMLWFRVGAATLILQLMFLVSALAETGG